MYEVTHQCLISLEDEVVHAYKFLSGVYHIYCEYINLDLLDLYKTRSYPVCVIGGAKYHTTIYSYII